MLQVQSGPASPYAFSAITPLLTYKKLFSCTSLHMATSMRQSFFVAKRYASSDRVHRDPIQQSTTSAKVLSGQTGHVGLSFKDLCIKVTERAHVFTKSFEYLPSITRKQRYAILSRQLFTWCYDGSSLMGSLLQEPKPKSC